MLYDYQSLLGLVCNYSDSTDIHKSVNGLAGRWVPMAIGPNDNKQHSCI